MAAGGFKEFVAGETLDEDDINDFLMQGVLVFAGTAARGSAITSPVEGQFSFRTDDDVLEFYDGSDWVEFSSTPGAAVASATTGSPTETTITDGGITYDVYQFTGDGSITFSEAGFAEVLLVGGGAGGGSRSFGGGGGAGDHFLATVYVAAGTSTVTVGAGGVGNSIQTAGYPGVPSRFGDYIGIGGGGGGAREGQLNGLPGGSGGGGNGGESANTGGAALGKIGFAGGNGAADVGVRGGGGGGGAGGVGAVGTSTFGGNGGAGLASSITGTSVTRCGGGGGGSNGGTAGTGGSGIGGNGTTNSTTGGAGTANTGSGGGGVGFGGTGGSGGSGIVIVRVAV